MITHSFVRGYRIMVITLAFQANDVSSILTIRSRIKDYSDVAQQVEQVTVNHWVVGSIPTVRARLQIVS